MTFFDRNTNFPWKSHGLWWLTQFRRWGMVGRRRRLHRHRRPGASAPISTARSRRRWASPRRRRTSKPETLFDGVAFDPAEPEQYAKSFAVNSLALRRTES